MHAPHRPALCPSTAAAFAAAALALAAATLATTALAAAALAAAALAAAALTAADITATALAAAALAAVTLTAFKAFTASGPAAACAGTALAWPSADARRVAAAGASLAVILRMLVDAAAAFCVLGTRRGFLGGFRSLCPGLRGPAGGERASFGAPEAGRRRRPGHAVGPRRCHESGRAAVGRLGRS